MNVELFGVAMRGENIIMVIRERLAEELPGRLGRLLRVHGRRETQNRAHGVALGVPRLRLLPPLGHLLGELVRVQPPPVRPFGFYLAFAGNVLHPPHDRPRAAAVAADFEDGLRQAPRRPLPLPSGAGPPPPGAAAAPGVL